MFSPLHPVMLGKYYHSKCDNQQPLHSHFVFWERTDIMSSLSCNRFPKEAAVWAEPRIQCLPFAYNLMSLLPRCQQAELLFSMFIQGKNRFFCETMT